MDFTKSRQSDRKYSFFNRVLASRLSNRTNDELSERLTTVKREIQKYKHMLDVAAYKAEINQLGETAFLDSPADDIENKLEVYIANETNRRTESNKGVIHKNTNFEKFIIF